MTPFIAPAVCLDSLMKLHVAMGDHLALCCQAGIDRLIGFPQHVGCLPQVHRLDVPLMGQHGQLVQVSAAGPQLRQDGLQLLHHLDGLPQGSVEQIFPLAQPGFSNISVDLRSLRRCHPKGDDFISFPVPHLNGLLCIKLWYGAARLFGGGTPYQSFRRKAIWFCGSYQKIINFSELTDILQYWPQRPFRRVLVRGMGVYLLLPEGGHTAPYRREKAVTFALRPCFTSSLITVYHFKQLFSLSPLAVRPQKVGVGFCPQNAFGCRSRQAKRSACPTQGWVNTLVGDVEFSEGFPLFALWEGVK